MVFDNGSASLAFPILIRGDPRSLFFLSFPLSRLRYWRMRKGSLSPGLKKQGWLLLRGVPITSGVTYHPWGVIQILLRVITCFTWDPRKGFFTKFFDDDRSHVCLWYYCYFFLMSVLLREVWWNINLQKFLMWNWEIHIIQRFCTE